MITHGMYSAVLLGHGLCRIHDGERQVKVEPKNSNEPIVEQTRWSWHMSLKDLFGQINKMLELCVMWIKNHCNVLFCSSCNHHHSCRSWELCTEGCSTTVSTFLKVSFFLITMTYQILLPLSFVSHHTETSMSILACPEQNSITNQR